MRSVEGYDVNEALGDCRDSTGVLEYSAHTQNSTVHTHKLVRRKQRQSQKVDNEQSTLHFLLSPGATTCFSTAALNAQLV